MTETVRPEMSRLYGGWVGLCKPWPIVWEQYAYDALSPARRRAQGKQNWASDLASGIHAGDLTAFPTFSPCSSGRFPIDALGCQGSLMIIGGFALLVGVTVIRAMPLMDTGRGLIFAWGAESMKWPSRRDGRAGFRGNETQLRLRD